MFNFSKEDRVVELPKPILEHVPVFVERRYAELEGLENAIKDKDFTFVRSYCHNILGIAAQYHFFKLEEISIGLQTAARERNIETIEELFPILKSYLEEKYQKYKQ